MKNTDDLIAHRFATYMYSIAAVLAGAITQMSGNTEFWAKFPHTSTIIGSAVPLCVGAGFLLEHPLERMKPDFHFGICFVALAIGLAGVGLFLAAISTLMLAGFLMGILALVCLYLTHRETSK